MTAAQRKQIERGESLLDPRTFSRAWLDEDPWEKQDEIMASVVQNRRTVVAACHSSAKTRTAACLALWWLAAWKEAVVITTAPGQPNLLAGIWAEIPTLCKKSRYPFPPPLTLELRIHEKRRAYGYTTSVEQGNQGVRFQGAHAANTLIIVDEASGVDMAIFSAINGIMASGNCRLLLLLNPLVSSGYAYDACTRLRDLYHYIKISAFDTPNLKGLTLDDLLAMDNAALDQNERPYLVTKRYVRDMWLENGNDFNWQSRVLGEFPEQGEDALVALAWAEGAAKEQHIHPALPVQAGIDVAGPGEDETVVYVKQGGAIVDLMTTPERDPRGRVVAFLGPYKRQLEIVNVDAVGIGYNFGLHLADQGFPVQLVNAGDAPLPIERDARKQYANLKAQAYWRLRVLLRDGHISNLSDLKTRSQLTSLRWWNSSIGQTTIEGKDAARKRGVKSPDRAEALMLAFVPKVVHNQSAWVAGPPVQMIAPI